MAILVDSMVQYILSIQDVDRMEYEKLNQYAEIALIFEPFERN